MRKDSRWPKVSIIILTINEEQFLKKCLSSIRSQKYPQKKIEILVVDNGSTDNSVGVAKSFGAKVWVNKEASVYTNWAFALHKMTGEFTYMVDQDITLRGRTFFQKMLEPLLADKRIMASFTRKYPKKDQHWTTRFISFHPAQCDPLYEFLTPPVEKSFIENKVGYTLCKFVLGKVPPFGRMFYRVKYLKKTQSWKMDRVFDQDLVVKSIKSGYDLFAYVPQAGLYHYHAKNLKHLLYKRIRNLNMHYFPENETTEYRWLDLRKRTDILRIFLWVIYANLFIPALLRGFVRFIKYKDTALLMEPVITIAITDVVILGFLRDKIGRNILKQSFQTVILGKNIEAKGAFGK